MVKVIIYIAKRTGLKFFILSIGESNWVQCAGLLVPMVALDLILNDKLKVFSKI